MPSVGPPAVVADGLDYGLDVDGTGGRGGQQGGEQEVVARRHNSHVEVVCPELAQHG